MVYWCMKLYETLKTNYEGNDDYEGAYYKYKKEFHKALIQLFESVQGRLVYLVSLKGIKLTLTQVTQKTLQKMYAILS